MSAPRAQESWYDKSVEQAEKRFSTERGKGLSSADVAAARREYGSNNVYKAASSVSSAKPIPTDFTSVLLIAVVFIARIFDVPIAASAIIGMLLINYGVTLFTYFKALKVLDGMTGYSLPTAKVLRDGKPRLIDMRALVPGDVIFLAAGDIVPADCRLFMSDGLYINEGTVTGVQSSIAKDAKYENYSPALPMERMANMAFASSIVTAGNGRAIVVATGESTAVCRLGKAKSLITHENLSILSTLKKYCSVWSLTMLGLIFVITLVTMFAGARTDVFNTFLCGVSLAVSAMSEFYLAFGYIIVGCGIFSAMKRRRDVNEGAIIKNAEKLECLKDITTLIIPKEGIITSSKADVEKIYTSRTLYSITDTERVDKMRATVLSGVISTGIYGSGLAALSENARRITPEEEALILAAQNLSLYNSNIDRMHPIIQHVSCGGASKFETTLTRDSDNRYMAVCRGDVETVLNSCEYYTENGRLLRMTTDDRIEFMGVASSLTKSSYRVVAVATGVTGYNNLQRIGSIQSDLTFEGIIAIKEPLYPGIAETVEKCRKAGIKVIMTTDRYAENDKYLAMSVGLINSEREILTDVKYDSMKPDLVRTNLPLYGMFAGLTSAKLSNIIKMMRKDGECVGLLAGGINGSLLLKKADVGFAKCTTISPKANSSGVDIRSRRMGAYSSIAGQNTFDSEALKFISDVVISDSEESAEGGFSAVVSALEYSGSIYRNLLRMVNYLTVSQLTRIFMILGSLLLGITAVLPIQLIFGGLIIDLGAILASAFSKPPRTSLSLRDNAEESLKKPLATNIRSLAFAMFEAVAILAIHPVLTKIGVSFTAEQYVSAAFLALIACSFVTFVQLATERSLFKSGMRISIGFMLFLLLSAGFAATALIVPSVGTVFGIVPIPLALTASVVTVTGLTFALHEIYKLISKQDNK